MCLRGLIRAAFFIGASVLWAQSETNTEATVAQGSMCIEPVTPPAAGMKSLANPAGGNTVKVYTIKLDDLPPLRGLPDRAVEVPPLLVAEKHAVRIFGDGKQVASFYFRFDTYTTNDLCLVFDEFYETWSLLDCENPRAWRPCRPRNKLPWVEVKSCEVVGTRVVPVNGQYYTDYQIKYFAEGRQLVRYVSSGLPPYGEEPFSKPPRALPKECSYRIRYHPGTPDKAEVSLR